MVEGLPGDNHDVRVPAKAASQKRLVSKGILRNNHVVRVPYSNAHPVGAVGTLAQGALPKRLPAPLCVYPHTLLEPWAGSFGR